MESLIIILSGFIFITLDIWVYFWVGIAALLIGVVGVGWWMLKYTPTKHDIISFEMTFSVKKMRSYLEDWYNKDSEKNQITIVIKNTWLDYIWLISYTLVLFSFCSIIARLLHEIDTTCMSDSIAISFAYISLLAGALDAIENGFLLWLLKRNKNGVKPENVGIIPVMAASIAAVFKFAFVAIVIFFIILGIITIAAIKLGVILSVSLILVLILSGLIFIMMAKAAKGK